MASSLTGIPRQAINSTGGIKKVYLAAFQDVEASVDASGVVTFATGTIADFAEYIPTKETSAPVETWTGSYTTGQGNAEQIITMVFHKQTVEFRNILQTLATNEMVAIVVDQNGNNAVYGITNGLDLTSNVAGSGVGPQDLSGYTITLRGNEPVLAGSVADTFLTVA